jgi:hypothetical protein
VLLDVLLLE